MENKEQKTPKIRFKGFNDAWEQRKFENLGYVSMCKRIFKDETTEKGEIPFYKIGTFGGMADSYISRKKFEEYKNKFSYPDDGDILLSASGTIGRIIEFRGEEAYFQDSNIVWLNHNNTILNSFLKHLYPSIKWYGIEGSTIKRLYNSNFLNTEFSMPSVKEQDKIGSLFENIDNLITLHQRKCDKLSEVKKSLLEKMFPKSDEKFPEIRFKGFTDAWEQRKLNEICKFKQGVQVDLYKQFNNSGKNLVRFIRIVDYTQETEDIRYIDKNYTLERINKDDVVLVRYGATAGFVGHGINGVLANNMFTINPQSELSKEFLYTYMKQDKIYRILNSSNGSSAMPALNFSSVGDVEIHYSKLKEQDKIAVLFKNIDNLITLHQRKLEKLKQIKISMLEKMFV